MHVFTTFSLLLALALAGCIQNSQQGGTAEEQADSADDAGTAVQLPAQPPAANEPGRVATGPLPPIATQQPEQQATDASRAGHAQGRITSQKASSVDRVAGSSAIPIHPSLRHAAEPADRERYAHFPDGGTFVTREVPVSTFSIDVDTGSYSVVRRMLNQGRLPVRDAVRLEEMINYFDYGYAPPDRGAHPFSVHTELGPTPWNAETRLLKVGIQGRSPTTGELPPANLVFLVDVSGSMRSADKLDLLKTSLRLLLTRLRAEDRIAIVVYAGASGLVLPSTAGDRKSTILAALESLSAGGSTHGAAGIRLAYQVAREHYISGGINRVLLATDGDFNVGTVNIEALKDLVARHRETGVTLTTLGFGSGNYNDHLMEQIADIGNGNYAYIDRLSEARKVLVQQMAGTLHTIASDVKIQVEFNPAVVSEYRLVGYENRVLRREDFNNDGVDAGDIGEGHNVTALYEIRLAGPGRGAPLVDALRYGEAHSSEAADLRHDELAFLKLRYKRPGQSRSILMTQPVQRGALQSSIARTSDNYRFAAAVAGFGQLLRGGRNTAAFGYDDVLELANASRGADLHGYRGEFIGMVELARALATPISRRDPLTAPPMR